MTLSPILLSDHCLTASDDGGVAVAPRSAAPGQKFRRVAAGGGAVRFVSASDPAKALTVAPDGLRLAPGQDAASAWKVD